MWTRNLDVTDGVVNGALGTVVGFIEYVPARSVVGQVTVGATGRQENFSNLSQHPQAVPITAIDVKFSISGKKSGMEITRQQIPLRLSWATTIHKVQGITMQQIVVSMEDRMADGQCYVAISRVPSLQGLFLLNFDKKKLKSSNKVKLELQRIRQDMQLCTFLQRTGRCTQHRLQASTHSCSKHPIFTCPPCRSFVPTIPGGVLSSVPYRDMVDIQAHIQ